MFALRPDAGPRPGLVFLRTTAFAWAAAVAAQTPAPRLDAEAAPPARAETPQDPEPARAATAPAQEPQAGARTQAALRALLAQLQNAKEHEARLIAEIEAAGADASAATLQELEAAKERVRDLTWRFDSVASSVDVEEYHAPGQGEFDMASEFENLLRPLLREVKSLTEEPRTIDHLRSEISTHRQNLDFATQAQRNAESTLGALPAGAPTALAEALNATKERWRQEIAKHRDEISILEARLGSLLDSRSSFVDGAGRVVRGFVESRGLNLLLAIFAFVAVFVSLRFVQRRSQGLAIIRRRAFLGRALNVALQVLVTVAAVAATLLTLYLVGDWLLLAIALVFLLGAGWVVVKMMPDYVEQLRLLLNLGAVREGERLLIDGVPYKIHALRLYSELINPTLQGGVLRLPLRDLLPLRSRVAHEDEPWFPSRPGDYVTLDDTTYGRILTQTPDVVVLRSLGARKTYRTADYLAQNPRNLSAGFTLDVPFGIDYAHQRDCTTKIPDTMRAVLLQRLTEIVEREYIADISVQFASAAASSLDFMVLVRLDGRAADRYCPARRAVQRILVDACTEHGWGIPFQQITVWRAPEPADPAVAAHA